MSMHLGKWDGLTEMTHALETTRLHLRRPTQADARVLCQLWRDEQVQQFMGGVRSQQDAEAQMASILQEWQDYKAGLWAVCEQGRDRPIGLCGFGIFEAEVEIIYKLFPTFWGRGYATEATTACLAYGFQILQLDCVIGITQEANCASRRVLEKVGMHYMRKLWRWESLQCVYEVTRAAWLAAEQSHL
ncbi:MAG: GNAT family N-acetyltransferase [Ktedonobacteraceae bacterium]